MDLAGSAKNDTGYALLEVNGEKKVTSKILHSDDEIISQLKLSKPEIVAVDAPLIYSGEKRICDELLREYGALPVTLHGMQTLAERGSCLAKKLESEGLPHIEVYSKASSKILGVYAKKDFDMQKNMMSLDLSGDLNQRLLVRDELDAISCAVTAYLHLLGQTNEVGDDRGRVVVPKV